eukprot:2457436-Pleurochrysis_carterae.AAC.1
MKGQYIVDQPESNDNTQQQSFNTSREYQTRGVLALSSHSAPWRRSEGRLVATRFQTSSGH